MSGYGTRGLTKINFNIAPKNIPKIIPMHSNKPNKNPHAVEAIGVTAGLLPSKKLQLPQVPPFSIGGRRRKTYKKRKTQKKRKTYHKRR
jgi:hypothetical protein